MPGSSAEAVTADWDWTLVTDRWSDITEVPRLRTDRTSCGLRLRWRTRPLGFVTHHDRVATERDGPVSIALWGQAHRLATPPGPVIEGGPGSGGTSNVGPALSSAPQKGRHAA